MMSLVPSLVHQLVHHPRFKTTDMSSVQNIGSGAAHLPPQLADELYVRFPGMDSITEGALSTPFLHADFVISFASTGYGLSEFVSNSSHYSVADLTARSRQSSSP
jgi:acyl-CoA synthetase (AMP-forming)/AMP-acid ligase II